MIRPVFLLTSFFLLSGCATTDWAAINKQVSDTAANLKKTLGGNDSGESGGMPLMSPAKLNGIISRDGEICILMQTLSTTGIKMATTPVELINAPSPATVSIR